MRETEFVIQNEEGLHSRPASDFCAEAMKFQSDVVVTKEGDDTEYDGKSILMVMCIGACKGDTIKIRANGPDEAEALDSLVNVLKNAE